MNTQLSKDNGAVKKKRGREERQKLVVRVVCMILAILMVAGMAYYTIYILASAASNAANAADITENKTETAVIDTSSLKNGGDVLISVGLMYGSNLTKGFETTTSNGYTIGSQYLDGDREFSELWDIDDTRISATVDENLSKTGMTYLVAADERETVIGGYHIQVVYSGYSREEFEDVISDSERSFERLGLYAIPSYIDSSYALRVGSFASREDALEYRNDVENILERDAYVVSPSKSAVSILNPETDQILFEYDCGTETELGLAAHRDENGNTYIKTPAGNIYDGVFCFKRYDNGDVEGVELINILPLESYIAGVLPYETSNTWPLETLKAFAITVRSFTLTHIEKHFDRYGFDLCNSTDCQVYKGAGRINKRIMDAVSGTAGEVMVYDNKIATAYYSSSMGGVTVSAYDAWGVRDVPYLQAVETPWERYMVHNNAFWITEISPSALAERLRKAGFEELRDEIESIEITELAENSTYVRVLKATDIHGTCVYIENTDTVRTSLTPYVKSANFVVGRGSVEYSENVVIEEDYNVEDEYEDLINADDGNGVVDRDWGYYDVDDLYVITAGSVERNDSGRSVKIATGSGTIDHEKVDVFVMARENTAAFLGDEYLKYAVVDEETEEDKHEIHVIEDKSTDELIYKIAYAEDSDNFIFVGKGWGHGVGMSQYGARDMAELGYKAQDILAAYFSGTEVVDYRDSDDFAK